MRRGRGRAHLQFFCRQRCQYCRQFDTENGAALLPIVRENFSAVLLDNAEANAKSQAGALAHRFCRIKRIKNALGVLEAGAGVREEDDDVRAVTDSLDRQTPPLAASMASKALLMILKKTCIN